MEAAIVDLDGTVYRSETPVPGATDGIETLRWAGVDVVFVTNTSTKTRETCRDRLTAFGIEVAVSDILTSAFVTATYVLNEHPSATVMVIGESSLATELQQAGATLTEDPTETDVLVVGNDATFDYDTLTRGLRAVDSGAVVVGTNNDRQVPTDSGIEPGAGALIAAISFASNQDPEIICGKPNRLMIDVCLDQLDTEPENCMIIGDNPATDIEMGQRAGLTTVLVLSGLVDSDDPLLEAEPADYIIDSVGDISTVLRELDCYC